MAWMIVWTKDAEEKFDKIVSFLENEYSPKTAERFVKRINVKIDLLKLYPEIGRPSQKVKGVRMLNIHKHYRMFYRVKDNYVVIIDFFNTKQDPKKKSVLTQLLFAFL